MEVIDFIIADDIRTEVGNKPSIMGVFGEDIILKGIQQDTSWPIPFRIAVFIRIELSKEDESPNKFDLTITEKDNCIANFDGNISVKTKPKYINLPLVAQNLPLSGPGELSFDLTIFRNGNILCEKSHSILVKVTTDK